MYQVSQQLVDIVRLMSWKPRELIWVTMLTHPLLKKLKGTKVKETLLLKGVKSIQQHIFLRST